jgi:hypothetical protein
VSTRAWNCSGTPVDQLGLSTSARGPAATSSSSCSTSATCRQAVQLAFNSYLADQLDRTLWWWLSTVPVHLGHGLLVPLHGLLVPLHGLLVPRAWLGTSHRIASHRIATQRIASHRIASHRIAGVCGRLVLFTAGRQQREQEACMQQRPPHGSTATW